MENLIKVVFYCQLRHGDIMDYEKLLNHCDSCGEGEASTEETQKSEEETPAEGAEQPTEEENN